MQNAYSDQGLHCLTLFITHPAVFRYIKIYSNLRTSTSTGNNVNCFKFYPESANPITTAADDILIFFFRENKA